MTKELAEARAIAERLLPLTLALFSEPSPAVIKAVLHAQGKIPTPHVRMPLADSSPAACEQALAALDAARMATCDLGNHPSVSRSVRCGPLLSRMRDRLEPASATGVPEVKTPHLLASDGGARSAPVFPPQRPLRLASRRR